MTWASDGVLHGNVLAISRLGGLDLSTSNGGVVPPPPPQSGLIPPTEPLTVNLQVGSTGPQVRVLQTFLQANGFYPAAQAITNYFGVITKAGVIQYQTAAGITPASGFCGPITRASINSIIATSSLRAAAANTNVIYTISLKVNTGNQTSTGWTDTVADSVLDSNFIKVSPSSITNIPYKLLAFLYTASASMQSNSIFVYTNIWSLGTITSANLTDSGGDRLSSAYTVSGKTLTVNGVTLPTNVPLAFYSLSINQTYRDRFELVRGLVVRFTADANYYTVINTPNAKDSFIRATQESLATALNIPTSSVVVLNLAPGSIIIDVYIPVDYVDTLRIIIQNGDLSIDYNGELYPVKKDSFLVIDTTCFYKDTLILTPGGYKKVQELQNGDLLKTAQGRVVPVKRMISFIGSSEKCPLYVIRKNSIAPNVPVQDLYMSEGHAFRHNGKWYHMKCSELAKKVDMDNIEYYNIVLDNYLENTLIANGVEAESLFEMSGLKMSWRCEEKCCKPVIERKKEL